MESSLKKEQKNYYQRIDQEKTWKKTLIELFQKYIKINPKKPD